MASPIRVSTKDPEDGGCNFCRDRNTPRIWEIKSIDPLRGLVIRICDSCMGEVRVRTSPRRR